MSDFILIQSEPYDQAAASAPLLSILIPYFRDNPAALIRALSSQLKGGQPVEILVYDDGTNDAGITSDIREIIEQSESPIRAIIAHENHGRAHARNTLRSYAHAEWVLFLDADMRPVTRHFVDDYLGLIRSEKADIIFGGFEVDVKANSPEQELHRAFSQSSDCLSLEDRQKGGPKYVCSSNLCVRKEVLDQQPFDPGFIGWGWEDSEWAARAAKEYTLLHADIPALHLGLETTDTLLKRFKESGPNYLLFTHKHPELAQSLSLFKAIKTIQKIPGQRLLRPILKMLVKFQKAPVRLRLIALKVWRASWYAEAFR